MNLQCGGEQLPAASSVSSGMHSWQQSGRTNDEFTRNLYSSLTFQSPGHNGPHREGYSEEKCRSVLVRECSKIPRNFNYADGIHMVVELLRNHLGDENLDLSIGVLYEFIEVNDTSDTWEETAAFRRWAHDHALRKSDFSNLHVPKLKNIVVGPIQPTAKLRRWRESCARRQSLGTDSWDWHADLYTVGRLTPYSMSSGIKNRQSWQINHATYISNPVTGTHMLACPSPSEFSKDFTVQSNDSKETFGDVKSTLHDNVSNSSLSPNLPTTAAEKPQEDLRRHTRFPKSLPKLDIFKQARQHRRQSSTSQSMSPADRLVLAGEASAMVEHMPICGSSIAAYSTRRHSCQVQLDLVPLPENAKVNGAFARKFCLVDKDSQLSKDIKECELDSAEEKVLKQALSDLSPSADAQGQEASQRHSIRHLKSFKGPLTANIFKDGGLDFRWS